MVAHAATGMADTAAEGGGDGVRGEHVWTSVGCGAKWGLLGPPRQVLPEAADKTG